MEIGYFDPKMVKYFNANSTRALYLETIFEETETVIASGTGFCCESDKGLVLVTNRHIVTGRHNTTNECLSRFGGIPNKLRLHILRDGIQTFDFNLYETMDSTPPENPLWFEHPSLGETADVVGILLPDLGAWNPTTVHIDLDWYTWQVSDKVNVVGFPFGQSAQGFAIWSTGYLASDPDIDYETYLYFS